MAVRDNQLIEHANARVVAVRGELYVDRLEVGKLFAIPQHFTNSVQLVGQPEIESATEM